MAIYYMMEPWWKKRGYTLDPVLDNNSWEAIQWAAQQDIASSTWSVGDRKAVVLNGTVEGRTFSNYTVYVHILGFNHNASVEGNNTIHFQFAYSALTDGKPITFTNSYWSSGVGFRMNDTDTNSGGWKDSYMRNTIIPAFTNAMPSDLRAVLKNVTKYTDNGTGSTHNSSSDVTATSDKVFLLSEYEIKGSRSEANKYEKDTQLRYDYYVNTKSSTKWNDQNLGSSIYWWERSPYYNNATTFCGIDYNGGAYGSTTASRSCGFAPGFVVG